MMMGMLSALVPSVVHYAADGRVIVGKPEVIDLAVGDVPLEPIDAPLPSIAGVRQGARHDHAHGVIEVGALHLVEDGEEGTGGAILGDRVRMQEHALDPGWAKRIGVDLESLLVSQPSSA